MSGTAIHERLLRNPFFVLELGPECSLREVERIGQKWLGLLRIGSQQAVAYATPVGTGQRDEELVRWAMSELRDPERRLIHELWARTGMVTDQDTAEDQQIRSLPAWNGARRQMGW
jgi:hypothetical protein